MNDINKNNNRILFFCPIPPPIGGQALISNIVCNLINPAYLINTNVVNKYTDTLKIILKLIWVFTYRRIELVYFTCTRSKFGAIKDIILLVLCKLKRVKVINHLHGNEIGELFDGSLIAKIIHWSYKQIDTTVFVTERQKQLMPLSLSEMNRVVIPNCYDPILDNLERQFESNIKEINILFISFLMKSKGVFVALDVFELIAKEYNNVIFNIAGEPHSDEYMSKIDVKREFDRRLKKLTKNYPGRFKYHGVVKNVEKKTLYSNNDILLFPTYFKTESFGLVNIEAMRTGNAIVTTDHNFLADIVTEKEGILVQPNDVPETLKAVKYLLDNQHIMRDIQFHNIDHALQLYSPEQFENNMKDLITSFLNKV